MVRKRLCFCTSYDGTDETIDVLDVKEIWVTTKWSYDKYNKQMLTLNNKSIGFVDRDILHQINCEVASSWREISVSGDSYVLMEGVDIATVSDSVWDTTQDLYDSKDGLLNAINAVLVKKPKYYP